MGGITVDKRKLRTLDISNKIGINFSKEFAKANYNYETYLHIILLFMSMESTLTIHCLFLFLNII